MSRALGNRPETADGPGLFLTTQWTLVLRGRDAQSPDGRAALAALCECYWYPLYVHIRRRVRSAEDAADLTQGFFAHLLESNLFASVAPCSGKLRAYLLACCNHFLANEWDRAAAQKRGGGRTPLSIDFAAAESRYTTEPVDRLGPDRLYERRWALTLLDEALTALERDYDSAGRGELFRLLKPALVAADEVQQHATIAATLGTSVPAVKKAAQRLRTRYGQRLRELVAATVGGPGDVDEELRDLFAAVAR
ncbi:rna sigma-24 ecf subfamily : RNA polymerase, sigma-24 subunit, ECF subfamily OS=Chthoniobacter flavus Ellin428 GN=CfE428DRAFT_4864 PE=4 SV=1 [Gemmata massiliana]|uniref:Rna sigma-24 ecf subfamily: RNA polymerase, sigma-24 subunit, ECF subfamily n=1 Tax=Gemmata massiliana TaxID=1210884 RepID=A0A6P2D9N9_9BACT|nr:sigma-70 family RNA polymerase sigma factor [Gemmata massiliana]VTR97889.1 rna sigma-24 ecf subfamily : RNA polymerase, sigma-24 subunit, ECF subfamily OS=Chthoniobacter flavus Ellin428 GN=CfE428DRAFT_4864 PE=4 SV=1 [Gemmata massiliana]